MNNLKRKKKMIRGCVGFSYVSGCLYGTMICVRGKDTVNIRLPFGLYHIFKRLWRRENILGKFLFKESDNVFKTKVEQN